MAIFVDSGNGLRACISVHINFLRAHSNSTVVIVSFGVLFTFSNNNCRVELSGTTTNRGLTFFVDLVSPFVSFKTQETR